MDPHHRLGICCSTPLGLLILAKHLHVRLMSPTTRMTTVPCPGHHRSSPTRVTRSKTSSHLKGAPSYPSRSQSNDATLSISILRPHRPASLLTTTTSESMTSTPPCTPLSVLIPRRSHLTIHHRLLDVSVVGVRSLSPEPLATQLHRLASTLSTTTLMSCPLLASLRVTTPILPLQC